jgi:hypothetical protein
MTEPIKAKCCDFGREYMAWNGGAWWVFGDFKAKACICGSELKKPLPEVVLTEEEWEIFKSIDIQLSREGRVRPYESWPDERSHKAIRSLLSRSRKAE